METANTVPDNEANKGDSDRALCRAALYTALAVGFQRPDRDSVDRILSRESIDILARAAGMVDSTDGVASAVLKLSSARGSAVPLLIASHERIFGHTVRGPVCPYETEYGAEALFQQPQQLGDLAGFYKAFRLALDTTHHERLDHVSCECEFMAFLCLKEAYAIEHDDTAMLEETGKAARLFMRDHLARFGLTFARKLSRANRGGFYGVLGDLCFTFLSCECERFGVEPGPVNLSLRPATDDRVPMGCGGGEECTAIPGAGVPEEME